MYIRFTFSNLQKIAKPQNLYDVVIATSEVHRSPIRTKTMFSVIKVY